MLRTLPRYLTGFSSLLYGLLALALALPVLAVLGSWLQWSPQSADILREMGRTVLPEYVLTTLGLCLMVAVGVTVLGLATAALVTLFDFPGRGVFEWLLLLPLAMPAYVVAYAYTDFLQFSGPLQVALREVFGLQGRLWPDVRSVWGAALVFTLALYPYVYLLARTALVERASGLMEAARLLGAPLSRRMLEIALPLARPAVAAGVALALMDFGRFWCLQLLRYPDLYSRHLQSLVVDGQPHCGGANGHGFVGSGGGFAATGATGPKTHAF